ncbi:MAG TPA: amino acid permease [Bacteroidota bacterium]|nr:amino acid permease [Bacteroidota bacterium]
MTDRPDQGEFKRALGLMDATTLVIGSMIGSGIFIVSADIARTIGSPGWLLATWGLTGIITLIAALSYGELAAMMPHAGGQYVYLREAHGPLVGFLYGWTLFLVIQAGTIAAVAIAFAKFTGVFVPWFSASAWIVKVGTFGPYSMPFGTMGPYNVGLHTQNLLAIGSIALLTWVNTRGIRGGKIVQNIFTLTKTGALLGLVLLGVVIGAHAEGVRANFTNMWNAAAVEVRDGQLLSRPLEGLGLCAALGAAMVGSLFSADAWNNITFTAGEVVHPRRNVPLSLAMGTGVVCVLYFLANVVYLLLLPLHGSPDGATVLDRGIQFAASDRVGTAAAQAIFGQGGALIMAAFIMISTFGCNNGLILAGARVYYAMAKDRVFFKRTGRLNARGVPSNALLTQGVWASLLCLSGTYSDLLDYVVFAVLIFYVLTILGIFILRVKRPDAERPYKAFGYPGVPALYIILASLICIDLLFVRPNFTWPGLIIVVLGLPVYYLWKSNQSKTEPAL